ncbi:MAG: guanylate kinase [Acidobacteriia bacterium]|nr:guanylate kinase [Terriglobia bacterium]
MPRKGSLIIVSGPSGAGKSALASAVLAILPGLRFSISYTTRAPRGNEREGVEYHFVTKSEFEALIRGGDLLEWAEVYGNYYGTARRFIDDRLEQGDDVLLDIDVQGARTMRGKRPDAISIFIMPPSYQVLRMRLENRRLDKEYVIEQRLKIARREIVQYRDYDYLIVNDEFDVSVEKLRAIILGSRCRMTSRAESAESIVATFGGMDAEDP